MSLFKKSAILAVVLCTANAASAATCSIGTGGSAATYGLDDATDAACFSGNDSNQIDGAFSMFGMDGWTLADKNDDASSGDQAIVFTDAPENGLNSGDWGISSILGYEKIVVTLKAANSFGAFLLDLTAGDDLVGTWTSTKDLSHASIYYTGTTTPPPPAVPLPAAGWMLLAGMGGLAAMRRKG